jgi:hypothetical protein
MRGVIHVHTRRSDGTGTVDDVAAAAARAGLQFVVMTDHGDATREAERPSYRSGVLCIDAVEISTKEGHLLALGLPASPYPLGGEARDVLEDVRRLGGVSIAAHPDSTRPDLRWADWNQTFDGVEWLNGDSQWRDEGWRDLALALLTYPFRRAATLTALLDRPEDALAHWDELTRHRPVVAVAAADAHARLGLGASGDPYRSAAALRVPSYEQVFRTLSISLPEVRPTGVPSEDARAVLDAIRRGAVYSTIDGLASPAAMTFSAASGSNHGTGGDRLALDGPVEFRVETNAPMGGQIVLLQGGEVIASALPPVLVHSGPPLPGVYRTEIRLAHAPGTKPVPWVVSNPIYIGGEIPGPTPSSSHPRADRLVSLYTDGPAMSWRVEKSARSQGTLNVVPSVGGTQVSLRYGIGGTESEGPYVAVAVPASLARADRLTFTARAMRPMRLSVQLRAPDATQDKRWSRSVYLDETAQTITVFFNELTPAASQGPPTLSDIRDILFVVDTVNTQLGSSGQIWLDDLRYGVR